jgi:hypothetical protein
MNIHMTYFKRTTLTDYSTQYVLRLFGINCWASVHTPKHGWLRCFGRGIIWKHKSEGLMFSQRYGYRKYYKIGNWNIEYLPYS